MEVDEGNCARAGARGNEVVNVDFNMATYMERVRKQSLKSQNEQKLIPKSHKMT